MKWDYDEMLQLSFEWHHLPGQVAPRAQQQHDKHKSALEPGWDQAIAQESLVTIDELFLAMDVLSEVNFFPWPRCTNLF